MRELFKYLKPYWYLVIISLVVLFLNSGADISIPYVTKMAIDRYITPQWVFLIGKGNVALPQGSTREFRNDTLLLNLHMLDKATIRSLEKKGLISKEHLLIFERIPSEIIEKYGSLFIRGKEGSFWILPQSNLRSIDADDLRRLRGQALSGVIRMALVLVGLLVISFGTGFLLAFLLQYIGQRSIHDLRMSLLKHILRLPVPYFNRTPVGRLTTRATNDLQAIHEMFASVLVYFIKDLVLLVGIVFIMFRMNRSLTMVLLVLIPIIFVCAYLFRKFAREAFRRVRHHIARINAFVQESLQGISVIQVFNAEPRVLSQFQSINEDLFNANMFQLYVFAVFRPLIEVFSAIAIALIIWHGGGEILKGTLTFGALVAFISYVEMLFSPIRDLAEKYNIVQSAMAAAERVFGVFSEPQEISGSIRRGSIKGRIEFRNVWFAYQDEDWVLKDVSFQIEPGEIVAIVGPTGAGKTSIISLLLGFYTPQRGNIFIDGIDTRELHLDFLRENIGVVFQDVFLFDGTIKENILLRMDLPKSSLDRALTVTQMDKLLSRMDRDLDTPIGERGASLSGGERQLLSFARAIARDYPVIILDEATSSIDPYTESLIDKSFHELIKGKTAIIIAHRLATLRKANKIIVVFDGRVVETGTHDELIEKGGVYYHLYMMQFKEIEAKKIE